MSAAAAPGDHQVMRLVLLRIPFLAAPSGAFPAYPPRRAVAVGGFVVAASARHVEVTDRTATYPAAKRLELDSGSGDIVVRGEDRERHQGRRAASARPATTRAPADTSDGRLRSAPRATTERSSRWDFGSDTVRHRPAVRRRATPPPSPPPRRSRSSSATGDVRGDGTRLPHRHIDSGTGDVVLNFAAAPRNVQIDSGTGDVTVLRARRARTPSAPTPASATVAIGFGIVNGRHQRRTASGSTAAPAT